MDDALSTSSSWHAHMTEDPPLHSRSQDAPATAVEGAGAVPLSIGPHLYQSVVGDNIAASSSPRVGSPLSCDSTMQVLDATALQQQQQHHQEEAIRLFMRLPCLQAARVASLSQSNDVNRRSRLCRHKRGGQCNCLRLRLTLARTRARRAGPERDRQVGLRLARVPLQRMEGRLVEEEAQ